MHIRRGAEFLKVALSGLKDIEKIHLSMGNSKMGIIPSFSVLPLVTCTNCGECSKYCYASKGCFNFNGNIMNLAENTALVMESIDRVKDEINAFLNGTTILYRYFRWNVAGDIFTVDYLQMMVDIAATNPWTTFLAFTKNYGLVNSYMDANEIPANLKIVFSRWDNAEVDNRHNLPVAITKIDDNTAIPENAFHCNGDCANCLNCWKAENGTCRYFDLH